MGSVCQLCKERPATEYIPKSDGSYDDYCAECSPTKQFLDFSKLKDRKVAEEMIDRLRGEGNHPMADLAENDLLAKMEILRERGELEE